MREIIHVQVGQGGNQAGARFWEAISEDHYIDSSGTFLGDSDLFLDKINVYYHEITGWRYMPRAVLVDLDPSSIDSIRGTSWGRLFRPSNSVFGKSGASNNFAKGYYTEGGEIIDSIMDTIRIEAECSDSLQGFQLFNSLGGGTGSGLGSAILNRIKDEYSNNIIQAFPIFPSPKVSDVVVEPYNTILSIFQLTHNTEQVNVLDNEALYDICFRVLKLSTPTYNDLNYLVSCALVGVTSSLRFSGQVNSDIRRLAENLVPFPRLRFCSIGYAPLYSRGSTQCYPPTIPQLINQIFEARNMLSAADPRHGKYLSAFAVLRARELKIALSEQLENIRQKNTSYYVPWIPDNLKSYSCLIPPRRTRNATTLVYNNTAIIEVFARILKLFQVMFRRRSFLHWFTGEGMEEAEFFESEYSLTELISEYQQYQDIDEEEDFGCEEEEENR